MLPCAQIFDSAAVASDCLSSIAVNMGVNASVVSRVADELQSANGGLRPCGVVRRRRNVDHQMVVNGIGFSPSRMKV